MQAEIQRDVEDRIRLTMLLIRQLAVFEFDCLVLGQKCHANGVRRSSLCRRDDPGVSDFRFGHKFVLFQRCW